MKIKRERYPLLEFKERQKIFTDSTWRMKKMVELSKSEHSGDQQYASKFSEFFNHLGTEEDIPTYLIADTVTTYLVKNGETLMPKLWRHIPEISDGYGCILVKSATVFYKKFNNEVGDGIILYCVSNSTNIKHEIGAVIKPVDSEDHQILGTPPTTSDYHLLGFTIANLYIPFLEFATVETKILEKSSHKKVKLNGEKYISDINADITVVDSNWFTTIVRGDGFSVKGHFRLVRVGVGRKQRKLTWVDAFEKKGYTRKARVNVKSAKNGS